MSSKITKLVLKKNKKLDKIYHPETGLVFKSATEKVVIGRIVDDEFIPLDEEALELCEQNHFKYDESLVETEEIVEKPTNSNDPNKKLCNDEDVQEDAVEEVLIPKMDKSVKTEKKKSLEVVEERKKSLEVVEERKKSNKDTDTDISGFTSILTRHTKELQNYVSNLQNELQNAKERVVELETQHSSTKKELEEVKKKLKGVLLAMQGDL